MAPNGVTVSLFEARDRGALDEMAHALWADPSQDSLLGELEQILISETGAVFICRKEDIPIGFLVISLRGDHVAHATSTPVGYIEGIYVKAPYRKLGIARLLYEQGEAWAKQKGCTQIGSDTWDWNKESILFHKKLHFKQGDTLVHFIKNIL